MTTPATQPARYGLVAFFRFLARVSPLTLGIAYTVALTIAVVLGEIGIRTAAAPFIWVARTLAVVAFSAVFTVVTWYRDDDTIAAALLIVLSSTVGTITALGLAALVFTGSIGPLVFLLAGGVFVLFLRLLIFMPVAALLVWVGRRLRRFFAPATMNDERVES